jgi:hypothetical protein
MAATLMYVVLTDKFEAGEVDVPDHEELGHRNNAR